MESSLNIEISCFENYRTAENPQPVNMLTWLRSAKYKSEVEHIRAIRDKEKRDVIKAALPAITPSGIFSYRGEHKLIRHSGLLQFDIDLKENNHIKNYRELKQQLKNINNIAYVGLSVSGNGFWGLVPIKYPEKHKQHFKALHEAFIDIGITIDTAPQNVASLRGYSCDPDGYFNHHAETFTVLKFSPKTQPYKFNPSCTGTDTHIKVEKLISKINTGITVGYRNWCNLGFALEDEFGESGRKYFHAISRYHSEYNRRECDKQYTHCLKHQGSGIGIGTFFHLCRKHGIPLNKVISNHTPVRENRLERKYESQKNGSSEKNSLKLSSGGYPAYRDKVSLNEGESGYGAATRAALKDCDNNFERLRIKDSKVALLSSLFGTKPVYPDAIQLTAD